MNECISIVILTASLEYDLVTKEKSVCDELTGIKVTFVAMLDHLMEKRELRFIGFAGRKDAPAGI